MASANSPDGSGKIVAVIGAGVAGLQAIRSLKERGVNVVCFDVEDGCGGQWHENYSSLRLQVPAKMYEFPDTKMKNVKRGELPSCKEVAQHCEEYMEKFGLRPHIQFSTEVVSISVGREKAWRLVHRKVTSYKRAARPDFRPSVSSAADDRGTEQEFDYVMLATGPFCHRQPFVPKVPGMDIFQGDILHSSMNLKAKSEEGKRVIVIGSAKSAHDQAVQACQHGATSVTQITRRAHWGCPQWVLGFIPFEYLFTTRFGEAIVHTCQGSSAPPVPWSSFRRLMNVLLFPLAWFLVKCVELVFIVQLSLWGPMMPKMDMMRDANSHGYCHKPEHAMYRRQGKLVVQLGEVVSYSQTGINVREGEEVKFYECDMVLYGTGYEKRYDLFETDVRSRLGDTSMGLSLYRQMLHPELPQLAFIGSEFNTISNMLTSCLQAEWVARWVAGDEGDAFLASKEEMWAQINEKIAWKKEMMELTHNAYNVDMQQINYGDTLLMDMGEPRFRKFPNVFAELFMPYRSAEYDGLVGKPLKNKSTAQRKAKSSPAVAPTAKSIKPSRETDALSIV